MPTIVQNFVPWTLPWALIFEAVKINVSFQVMSHEDLQWQPLSMQLALSQDQAGAPNVIDDAMALSGFF